MRRITNFEVHTAQENVPSRIAPKRHGQLAGRQLPALVANASGNTSIMHTVKVSCDILAQSVTS